MKPTIPISLLLATSSALAQNCSNTSTGLIPLNDLGAGLYLNQFQGGLYPNGSNTMPGPHMVEGLARAAAIVPLDVSGQPSSGGRYVMVSVGMSNTTQEFCSQSTLEPCDPYTFVGRASRHNNLNRAHLVIVNGAKGGQTTATWDNPADPNYNRVRDEVLAPRGLSEAQVQIAWVKLANAGPTVSLPNPNADAFKLVEQLGDVVRAMKARYPNLKMVFLSSRIYGGYATGPLNPEPYAYESGFAVKWLIEGQLKQVHQGSPPDPRAGDLNYNTVAPWLAWGPYLWADGLEPRSDGLTYACSDFAADGVHPAAGFGKARDKVGQQLEGFFFSSPLAAPWLKSPAAVGCFINCDGSSVAPQHNVADFACFLESFAAQRTYANCDGSSTPPMLNITDFTCFLSKFAAGCP